MDWNQIPPDNNTGIQFPVQLAVDGALSDSNSHVLEANTADFSRSTLTVKTDVTNNTDQTQTGDRQRDDHLPGPPSGDRDRQHRDRAAEHHEDGGVRPG